MTLSLKSCYENPSKYPLGKQTYKLALFESKSITVFRYALALLNSCCPKMLLEGRTATGHSCAYFPWVTSLSEDVILW